MAWFEKALEANVMSTRLLIRANVSKAILLEAYAIAKAFEARYSAYKPESFLNQINANAGIKPLTCKPEDYDFFLTCKAISEETKGAFDISIGALSHSAYHYGFSNQAVASSKEINTLKNLVNYKNIELTPTTIYLKKRGMRLDVGAIGKGYVAKQIALFLQKRGASKLLVDVGGEIISVGKSYTIALRDPFSEGNLFYIKSSKAPLSISTSGSYERYIDKKNHHILSHKEGVSKEYFSSLSLLQNSMDIDKLDAYATALYNSDLESNKALIEALHVSVIAVDMEANITELYTSDLDIKMIER